MGQEEIKKDILKVLPSGKELYPFQIDTIANTLEFLHYTSSHSAYIANEQGLGKSITSIITAQVLNSYTTSKCASVLIICPAIMRLVWEEEIKVWTRTNIRTIEQVCVLESSKDLKAKEESIKSVRFIICSYSLITKKDLREKLLELKCNFNLLILDEANAIKNITAKRTKVIAKEIVPVCDYKLYLSGTPMTRSVVDCFVPFHLIDPARFPSFTSFAREFSKSRPVPWGSGTEYYGIKNAETLSKHIRSNFFIRYKKKDVLTELPAKQYKKVFLGSEYHVDSANSYFEEVQSIISAINEGKGVKISSAFASLRQAQGVAKVPGIIEYVDTFLEQEIPVVVFAYHKSVIALLEEHYKKLSPPIVITGDTPAEVRQVGIKDFQSGKRILFIGNIIAAGVGITLTASSDVIFAEHDYSPATMAQATDRVHRIGAKDQVTVHSLVVKDSIEERIERVLMQRVKDFKSVIG